MHVFLSFHLQPRETTDLPWC